MAESKWLNGKYSIWIYHFQWKWSLYVQNLEVSAM